MGADAHSNDVGHSVDGSSVAPQIGNDEMVALCGQEGPNPVPLFTR